MAPALRAGRVERLHSRRELLKRLDCCLVKYLVGTLLAGAALRVEVAAVRVHKLGDILPSRVEVGPPRLAYRKPFEN